MIVSHCFETQAFDALGTSVKCSECENTLNDVLVWEGNISLTIALAEDRVYCPECFLHLMNDRGVITLHCYEAEVELIKA